MDRVWFLTWTTYGTWLPGDDRGFVTDLRDDHHQKYRPNRPRTECPTALPGLNRFARAALRGQPITLTADHADVLLAQFRETAAYRRWTLLATAVMWNHAHLLVGVSDDPDPDALLRDFKSYGSRALNRRWPRPMSGTWWTEGGFTRKKTDATAVRQAVAYVRGQPAPLATWVDDLAVAKVLGERPASAGR